ncbi:DUF763 domain-containing protein [Chlamydiota bacterium]
MKIGTTLLPLHGGKAPYWLFNRMKNLARGITEVIVSEFGQLSFLEKIADPLWFQAFGCVLGFDWHSNGLTTTTCGALKEGLRGIEKELGIYITGGKGRVSRKTPEEISNWTEKLSINPHPLTYASRLAAKVDNSALQDGYKLYHHVFIFTKNRSWSVIQQGMNEDNRYARRYHWLSTNVSDFVCEPRFAICCDKKGKTLNFVSKERSMIRHHTTIVANENQNSVIKEIKKIKNLHLPKRHYVSIGDINIKYLYKIPLTTYENKPTNFENLLGIHGVGPKTIRALSLIAGLIYGSNPSMNDPVRYSFAHGGKYGYPYPVDRSNYDNSIQFLNKCIKQLKIGNSEKIKAFKRLFTLYKTNNSTNFK